VHTTIGGAKWLWIFIILVLLLLLLYLATSCKERPECPHDWDFTKIQFRDKRERLLKVSTLNGPNLSGPQAQTNVPEFNDCQRLVIGTGKAARYDSLYAVFAHDSLDDTLHTKTVLDTGAAFPMVEILSLGGTYPQLELNPGLSCLFVFKENNNWYGRMMPFGEHEQDCHSPRPRSEVESFPALSIRRTNLHLKSEDYPAVARWEWDVRFQTQVIGFRCLDEWCEVGKNTPETGPDLTATMGDIAGLPGDSPVLKVKGWYDDQRLSPTERHWWQHWKHPRSVVGTIVPVPGLAQLESPDFDHTWNTIAYVNLSEQSNEYDAAASFVPKAGSSVTTISLCMEHWAGTTLDSEGCEGITEDLRQAAKCAPEPAAPTIHWWARTIPAGSSEPRYWCIVRRSVPDGVPVPGTARWRWMADDETTWGRCGGACCSGH
jgi:hypothetical protein